jgi:photosystem II stability/assembly factor-like uncharacterized protein
MKHFIFALCLGLISFTYTGQAAWNTPLFSGSSNYLPYTLNDVSFSTDNIVWAVGNDGVIYKSIDAGDSWTYVPSNTPYNLNGVMFLSELEGIVVGDAGTVLITTDGGLNWSAKTLPFITAYYDGHLLSSTDIVVAGADGIILTSADGGDNWTLRTSGTIVPLRSISFISSTIGLIAGDQGKMLYTSDGGATWSNRTTFTLDILHQVEFVTTNFAIAVGALGTMVISNDGGSTWALQTPQTSQTLYSVSFYNALEGFAIGSSTMLYTSDGGASWIDPGAEILHNIRSIDFNSLNEGIITGSSNSISKTYDSGLNWMMIMASDHETSPLRGVHFVNESIGWVVGDNGFAMSTIDGGAFWTNHVLPTSEILGDVFFFDANYGWISGNNGTILATVDGGLNWVSYGFSTAFFNRIYFVSQTTGWVLAAGGDVFITNDGGQTWTPQLTSYGNSFNSMMFLDDLTGWIVGSNGLILKTTDGGLNWIPQTSGTANTLTDIYFLDSNFGWAVGASGTVIHTNDGGTTWNLQGSLSINSLRRVAFADTQNGWTIGLLGELYRTTDGGQNWVTQESGTRANLMDMQMLSTTFGVHVNFNGGILYYRCTTPAPTANASETFCDGALVSDLLAVGTDIMWYDQAIGGTAYLSTDLLQDGFTYYAAQVIEGCESDERTPVVVMLEYAPATPNGIMGPNVVCENSSNLFFIGTDPYATNYNWSFDNGGTLTPNINEADLSITTSGILSVTAENACGTSPVQSLAITVNPLPQLTGPTSAGLCSGETVGLALTASVASNFEWLAADNINVSGESTLSQFTASITDLLTITGSGNQTVEYTVTPTSLDGCIGNSEVYYVDIYALPELPITPTDDPTQCGLATGGLIGGQAIGTQPVDFYWYDVITNSLVGTSADLTNQPAGDYYVDLIDTWGCTAQFGNFSITSLAPPSAPTGDAAQVFCFAAALEELTIQGSNITWYDAATDGTVLTAGTPLQDGSLYYASQFVGGCESDDRFEVSVTIHNAGNDIVLNVTPTESECNENTGGASVAISGGTTPYSILWDNGSSLTSATALSSGIHYVNVEDALGCTALSSFMINTISGPQITLDNVVDNLCAGELNGAINITVSGGETPYEFQWSNHATTQNIADLAYGCYEVTVTDANGCSAADVFFVNEPAPLFVNHTATAPACAATDGSIALTVGGGVGGYQYTWSNGATTAVLNNIASGVYTVNLADANGCEKSQIITLNEVGSSGVLLENIVTNDCEATTGSAYVFTLGLDNTFLWSDNSADEDLIDAPSGDYTLEVTNGDGCKSYLSVAIAPQQPQGVELCIVTVDEITNANVLVWEKPITTEIAFFTIYRESCQQGVYHLIHTQAYSDESLYEDDYANADNRGWKYRISAVSTCGVESVKSDAHRAIHLMMTENSGTYNLIWTDYEGFEVATHDVYRYTTATGAVLLAAIPAGTNTFSDTPTSFDELSYFVVADPGYTCTSSRANINTSRSNTKGVMPPDEVDGINEMLANAVGLYPNPSTTVSQLMLPTALLGNTITVTNAVGQIMWTTTATATTMEMDISQFANGIYYIQLNTPAGMITKKLVKQ